MYGIVNRHHEALESGYLKTDFLTYLPILYYRLR